jgi:hypothetical protein
LRASKDSFLFPVAVALSGLPLIFFGVQYQRRCGKIAEVVPAIITESARSLRPIAR